MKHWTCSVSGPERRTRLNIDSSLLEAGHGIPGEERTSSHAVEADCGAETLRPASGKAGGSGRAAAVRQYVELHVLPQYDSFDAAHRRDHVLAVIARSMDLATHYNVDADMLYMAAACHDIGLCEGRERHHVVSARLIREDMALKKWFSDAEVEVIACAAEDHRASSARPPRSIYGRIVAEADRLIDPELTLRRTVQYGLSHYPGLGREKQYARVLEHLACKYVEGGYLRLWIPESPNAQRLAELRALIADAARLRQVFDRIYDEETGESIRGM